ncbi:MAG: CapA family protein [Oscillospiraceae bacterium]|nr:CapA family protein [Oscillospiraceae bacterium]
MIFTGDVLLDASVYSLILREGLTAPISPELMETLAAADLTGINLEMPFSERGEPEENKQYTFRGDPATVELLNLMGVNYCALGNNHTLDFGVVALFDTLALLDQNGIGHSGAGIDLEAASRPAVYELGGRRVAVLSASRVIPRTYWHAGTKSAGLLTAYDPANLVKAIKAAKETADICIVFVHWGVERSLYPEDYQKDLARHFTNAGADVIVGTHPHVLQGFEFYGDSLVAYSLGNFIFNNSRIDTAALRVSADQNGVLSYSVIPCRITRQSTGFMPESEHRALFDSLTELSFGAGVDAQGVIYKIPDGQ